MQFEAVMATESHPEQDDWLSPECVARMAEQAPGLPVTRSFQDEPIGRVVSAEVTADGLLLTMNIDGDSAGLVASPEFRALGDEWSDDETNRVIRSADLQGIGLTDD